MEFNKLLKNTSLLATTRLVQFLTGLFRIKLVAYFLGTFGTGLVDQLIFATQRMSQFTLLSMSEAIVKQIAENKETNKSVQIINSAYKIYILLLSFFAVISCLILFYFADFFTKYIFGDISFISFFYVGIFSFPLLLLDSIPFSILKAFKNVKVIAKARIFIVIVNLVLIVPLILIYKLEGAIASVPVSYFTTMCINFYFANKIYFKKLNISISSILNSSFNISFVKEMFVFSTFGLTVGVFSIISEFVCRSLVVSELGVDSIGLYSPIIMWGGVVTGFILPSFSTYLYPRFCEIKSSKEISNLINDALRLGTFAVLPLIFIGIPFMNFFISTFYSNEFLEATLYLPYHFIGIVFYVWWYVFSQSMTPTGRIKQHGFFLCIFFLVDIIITYIFISKIGLYAWMLKHIVSPFIFFWIYLFYAKIKMDFKMQKSNIILMLFLLVSSYLIITISFYLNEENYLFNFILTISSLASTIFFLNKEEKKIIRKKLLNLNIKIFLK